MPPGGARPGAGRPPTDLQRVIDKRQLPDGTEVPVTIIDRVEETIRRGSMVKDAAARVGVSVETLRRWVTLGARMRQALSELDDKGAPKRNPSDLSVHERNCLELVARMDKAEAEARTALMARAERLAHGGYDRVERIEKRDPAGNLLEVTIKTVTAEADFRALAWIMTHRWPADFTKRVEVTGAAGGPVLVEAAPVADRLREYLGEIRANRETYAADLAAAATAEPNGNGHGSNGNGHQS